MANGNNNYQSERITMSPINLLKLKILNRRDIVIDYLEQYYYNKSRGINPGLIKSQLNGSIKALYYEIKQSYDEDVKHAEKQKKTNDIEDIKEKIESKDVEENIKAFNYIDFWLYNIKKITMFDSNKSYDRTDPLLEDMENNLG